jgi:hypothetical protein
MVRVLLVAALFSLLAVLDADVAWAGPGGVFVKAAAKSTLGKIVFGILGVLFLPLIIWVLGAQALGVRRTRKELELLAKARPEFAWGKLEAEARAAVLDIYAAWKADDLAAVEHRMAPEYFESQKELLERWRDEGKVNVIDLRGQVKLKPLFVKTETVVSYSLVALLVEAQVVDYLQDESTGKVLKGKKEWDPGFEAVWVLTYREGRWLVTRIEDGSTSLSFARLKNEIDPRYLTERFASEPAVAQAPEQAEAVQRERAPKQVAGKKRHG